MKNDKYEIEQIDNGVLLKRVSCFNGYIYVDYYKTLQEAIKEIYEIEGLQK